MKTSSLGDIVQSFVVLDELKRRFPDVEIDWAVESASYPIVAAHPLVRRAIRLRIKERKGLWKDLKELRRESYDYVFDLQGNCKSGLITLCSRGEKKVGYALGSVREWPNIFATHMRHKISKEQNIRLFYLQLLEKTFGTFSGRAEQGVRFKINEEERQKIAQMIGSTSFRIMVCPGSKWINKQVPLETLVSFLKKMEGAHFFLIWGDLKEKGLCQEMALRLPNAQVVEKLSLPAWQNLMCEMDLVVAVDSSALHLCGTTSTPSFSIFGPTRAEVFKPIGPHHLAIQGKCPYERNFAKQCPVLRTCPTGACVKTLTAEELFQAYQNRCGSRQP